MPKRAGSIAASLVRVYAREYEASGWLEGTKRLGYEIGGKLSERFTKLKQTLIQTQKQHDANGKIYRQYQK